jgi:hypothetical protein
MRVRRAFCYPWVIGLALASVSLFTGMTPAEAATQPPPSPFVLPCPGVTTCPSLVYNSSGTVQTNAHIYLLFWGSQWTTAPYSGQLNKVIKFFRLLPGSDWQQALHPYRGNNGHIKGVTYGGATLDSSDPPVITQPPDSVLDPEILAAAASQNWTMNSETQVIVFTEPGKSDVTYCGVHGAIQNGGGALFAWIPYTTDPPHNTSSDHCTAVYPHGSTSKIPIAGDLTWAATHELAENATAGAWTISPSDNGSEIGDPCNGVVSPFDREPGAGVYVQYLLDRVSGECADYQAIQPTANPTGASDSFLDGSVSCPAASACMAVGRSITSGAPYTALAEQWDGTTWSIQPTASPPAGSQGSYLDGVSCPSSNLCSAVGFYVDSTGTDESLAEIWDGTAWTMQPTPNPTGSRATTLLGVSCPGVSYCVATGFYLDSTGVKKTLSEIWDGTGWSIVATPNPSSPLRGSFLQGVSCTNASACIAVGSANTSSAPQGTPLAEHWNGSKWAIQSTPTFTGGALASVSCTSGCTAVGNYSSQTAGNGTLVAFWTGTAWGYSSISQPNAALSGVSCVSRYACTAVGHMQDSSGTTVTLAENPADGSILPTPNPAHSTGSTLDGVSCTDAQTCTAVGSYTDSSGTRTLAEAE